MCLLSVYSPYALVDTDHLDAGACHNPDGYGFAVIVGDRIEFAHGMDAYATIEAFASVRERHPESWALFHSRFTTDGLTSEANCHPFIVGGDERTLLAHNGILPRSARPKGADIRSDTRILAESLIPNGHFGKLHRPKGRRKLEQWIGSENYPNKVAILTVDPRYRGNAFILGEGHGEWVDGVWHSNRDYVPWVPASIYSSVTSSTAWERYLSGEISLRQYLDMTQVGPKLSECPKCDRTSTVDQAYQYCRECRLCLDCLSFVEVCDCWSPQSAPVDKDDSGDGIDSEAVEAALKGLPADQAQQIRDTLAGAL